MISCIICIVAIVIMQKNDFTSVARAFTLAPPPSTAKAATIDKKKSTRKSIQVNHHTNYADPFTIQPTQSFKATTSRPVVLKLMQSIPQHTVMPSSVECPVEMLTQNNMLLYRFKNYYIDRNKQY